MKKVLVFLLACLSSTMLFAQDLPTTTHWNPDWATPVSPIGMTCTAILQIDGEEQHNGFLEVGVFTTGENPVCRGAKLPKYRASADRWLYQITIKAIANEELTFKVYDHENSQELDLTTTIKIIYRDNDKLGSTSDPYVLSFTSNNAGFTLDITPYSSNKDHYYLIASPVGQVNVTAVENLTSNSFDLYYFDQSEKDSKEWVNYRGEGNAVGFTTLEAGKGYLYANNGDGDPETNDIVTLTFNGDAYSGDGIFPLEYDENAELKGWNLMGNPYAVTAYVDHAFYVMNTDGTGYISQDANASIDPMLGCFVVATEEGQSVTFSTQAPGKSANLALNLSNGSNVVDRAILSFNENTLPKFMLNENSTKIYIPVDGKDFAVVSAENQGEMPVNFKAEVNGTYNLSINPENVEFGYLHLIDNLTGDDVNLLETPSYSFNAKTTDYANRFRLVFAAGNNSTSDSFAFYNNGNLVINNEGNAILQIVDVLGRVISSQNINGSQNVSVNANSGVYTIQLIQGDNVKTQKIVVE